MRLRALVLSAFSILLCFCYSPGNALFEDQIGKFDWSAKHLGCFQDVVFDTTEDGEEVLVASSAKNSVGRINTNTGDLEWRQLNENGAARSPKLLVKDSRAAVLLNNGEYIRVFDVSTGLLRWQHMLNINITSNVIMAQSNRIIVVLAASKVHGFLGKDKLTSKWATHIDQDSNWSDVVIVDDSIFVIGALKSGKEVRVLKLDIKTGGIEKVNRLVITDRSFSINSCIISGQFFVCPAGNTIFATNFVSSAADGALKHVSTSMDTSVLELRALSLASGPSMQFVVQTSDSTVVCTILSDGGVSQSLKLDRTNVFALTRNFQRVNRNPDGNYEGIEYSNTNGENGGRDFLFAAYYSAQRLLKVFDLKSKNALVNFRIATHHSNNLAGSGFASSTTGGTTAHHHRDAPVKSVHFVGASESGAFQVLVARSDCRVDFHEAHVAPPPASSSTNDGNIESGHQVETVDATLEWVRFEALSSISGVELIDLPLSDSQARIETEFGAENEPVWKTFFLRVTSQMEQLQRSFVALSNRFAESMALFTSRRGGASPSAVLRHLFGYDEKRARRQRSATVSIKEDQLASRSLERDYFNLRKLIIVSTLSGSVYALSNDDGEVIWSLYLGDDMIPFSNQLGQPTIPLFIQRGTTLFQYASQAAVVFNSKRSKKSSIFVFNPVTGAHFTTLYVENLKRVELMPFANAETLRPLILIDEKEAVQFYPDIEDRDYRPPKPIYIMFLEKNGEMRGTFVDFTTRKLAEVWRSRLGFLSADEKIVAAAGKPQSQMVHSQGKVLGDRSVLYKYANPNLIAIATVDDTHSSLGIWLVDGINGQLVHSARHSRSQQPVRLVHCENWLTYTYWNDKARRTEMGIIELYEGLDQQTNAKHFNSFTTLKQPLTVFAQSYVFSQGVSAIAASETEQGLSSRSLIVAMPFGGVLEISRRFVDARRPLEMTPELREEMVIPYIPELPVATEDLINYNRTVHNVHGIRTSASGLESTSLVFVYGLDLFYTRVTPSGTFDILKDDFDYLLISLVMVVLVAASVLSKRLWRYNSLKQAWL